MSENCNHDCSSCSQNCGERETESMLFQLNEMSKVKKVIGYDNTAVVVRGLRDGMAPIGVPQERKAVG